jgi:hypothetical protein
MVANGAVRPQSCRAIPPKGRAPATHPRGGLFHVAAERRSRRAPEAPTHCGTSRPRSLHQAPAGRAPAEPPRYTRKSVTVTDLNWWTWGGIEPPTQHALVAVRLGVDQQANRRFCFIRR